ncbi:hypothetical protein ACFY12_21470 [Streptomyces sp. NPDC001339]|uniref:hypothetical protein n=1 Tax=Streptomyces sp. NPDC001339 TaxID=3364563 RepID=UPI0036737FCE
MTEHLTDDVLARLARTGPDDPHHRRHLDACQDCLTRMSVWQDIGAAVRSEAVQQAVRAPSFEALLGPALAGASTESAGEQPFAAHPVASGDVVSGTAHGVVRPCRTAWQLALRQAVLMPRLWAPLSAIGLVGTALLASARVSDRFGLRLFGAVVVLVIVFGALVTASPRRDPRRELLHTLPVPPTAVFLARVTVVLCVDVALAMVCSTLVAGPGWWAAVSSWLGTSLFAASLALALSVRFAPAAGAAAGAAVWLLNVVVGPQGVFTTPLDALLRALLSTTPWTLLLSVALLGWAVGAMRSLGKPESWQVADGA